MEKKYKSTKSIRAAGFFKRNVYYIVGGVLLLGAAVAMILVFTLNGAAPVVKPGDDDTKPVDTPITFVLPVEGGVVSREYSADKLVWNANLKEWATHEAIDFTAEAGASVLAAYKGTVESVQDTLLNGTVVTIAHEKGLKTVYMSLDSALEVSVGDTVTTGQVIGKISDSQRVEKDQGAHLHFEVFSNSEITDPAEYIPSLGDK